MAKKKDSPKNTRKPANQAAKKTAAKAAKKTAAKVAKKSTAKTARKSVKQAAKKAPPKPAPAVAESATNVTEMSAGTPTSPPPVERIAETAYQYYLERIEKGLPGDEKSDWLAAEQSVHAA